MARSKEAIKRRAAKRGVDEVEMRIRDNPGAKKQKGNDEEAVSVSTSVPDAVKAPVKASNAVVKAPAKASNAVIKAPAKAVSDDWVCAKCNNKNFATRSNCNRCGDCRGVTPSPSAPAPTVQPAASKVKKPVQERPQSAPPGDTKSRKPATATSSASSPSSSSSAAAAAAAAASLPPTSSSALGTKEGTWKCPHCTNSNFPQRSECNRCGTSKPSSTAVSSASSSSSSGTGQGTAPVTATATSTKSIPKSKEQKKTGSDGKGKAASTLSSPTLIVKTKWAKQASQEAVAENQRLREVAARLLANQGSVKSSDDSKDGDNSNGGDGSSGSLGGGGGSGGGSGGEGVESSVPTLTEAQMARAKILLERTQRKKEKKETMKKWKDKKQLTKAKQRQLQQKPTATTGNPVAATTAKSTAITAKTATNKATTTTTTTNTATTSVDKKSPSNTTSVAKKVVAKQITKPKPKPKAVKTTTTTASP